MRYRVEIKARALRALSRILPPARNRIERRIDALADEPRPAGVKKVQGTVYYRLRSGEYRVVYRIKDDVLVVLVVRVGHRKDVYRKLED